MAQHDYDVANGSGSTVRADINSVLGAIASMNSGVSAPSTTFAYMFWADTTTGIMKMRNGANTAWISLFNTDGTTLDNTIGNADLRQSSGLSVIGRSTNSTGNVADITAVTDGHVLRLNGTTLGFGTVATAGISDNAVTDAKLRQGAALSVIGVTGNATANVADIAAGTDGFVLRRNGTALGFGTVATAGITDNAVTNAKIRQGVALSVVGVTGNATANVDDIAAGTDGFVLRRNGTALGFGTVATAGIADAAITSAKLRDSAALSVIGRASNTSGVPADIAAGTDGYVLARSGTTLAFGQVLTAGIANNNVTDALLRQGAANTVIGRSAATTGNVADIAASTDGHVLRLSGTTLGFGTVATAGITANAITNVKLAQMANNTIKGRVTAGTGDPEDLSAANVKTILALVKGDVGLGNVDNTADTAKPVSTAQQTALNLKADLASPVLTGTPTAPTAPGSDNTLKIANTTWVNTAIAGAIASGVADGDKGDVVVSGSGLVWTIDAGVVSNSKLANMATSTMKGRLTAGTGSPEDLSVANVKTLLAYTKSDISLGNVDNTSDATKLGKSIAMIIALA